MAGARNQAAFVELSDGTFWIFSGQDTADHYTSEYYSNGIFNPGPDLPTRGFNDYPCAARINDSLIYFNNDIGMLFNVDEGTFTDTNQRVPRRVDGASCGAAKTPSGDDIVIVAGGYETKVGYVNTTQVLDVASGNWTELGPALPSRANYQGRVLQTETSFLIVGGYDGSGSAGYMDTVLEFDPVNMAWIEREETLGLGRRAFFVAEVDRERFCDD